PPLGPIVTLHFVTVELAGSDPANLYMPDKLVAIVETNDIGRLASRLVKQQQIHRRSVARVKGEVHPAIDDRRAERILATLNKCLGRALRKSHEKTPIRTKHQTSVLNASIANN